MERKRHEAPLDALRGVPPADGSSLEATSDDSPTMNEKPLMQNEEELANRIALIMLESNCFAQLNAQGFEAKRESFIATMVRRFAADFRHDVIRRVASEEFETGLEIIKLRNSYD